jgi:hypothetical protein
MSRRLVVVGALLFPFVVGYLASYYYPGGFALAQGSEGSNANPCGIALLAALMIVGIFSSFVFEKAKKSRRDGTPISLKLASIVTDFQFVAALFVSPLIFNSIYALVGQNPESLGDFLLAYQNGFFWQTVLAGVAAEIAHPGTRTKRSRAVEQG